MKPDFGREQAPAVGFALYVSETDRIPAASAILVSRPQAFRLMGRRAASGLLGNAGDSSAGHLTCLSSTIGSDGDREGLRRRNHADG